MVLRPPRSSAGRPALIVGAGSAGLSVATALRRRHVPATVLEQAPQVGAAWRGRYAELRLNTTRRSSGIGLPRTAGRWPGRDDYVAALESLAITASLDVRCGVPVYRIDRAESGWTLRTGGGDLAAAHVVVATGRARLPRLPDWPGRSGYRGRLLHVGRLPRVADLAGATVLVVGGGNSGVDLVAQLAEAGPATLWFSVRTPPTVLPLEIAGLPVQPLGIALRHLPEPLRDATARAVSRLAPGDLTAHGLPAPPVGPYARLRTTGVTTAVDRGFARHLRAGRLEVVPDVVSFTADAVVLRDGRRLRPDVVVATTGFAPGLEPLVGHLGVLDDHGLPRGRPGHEADGMPGLWFAGFWPAIEGDLRRHPIEARRIARGIARAGAG